MFTTQKQFGSTAALPSNIPAMQHHQLLLLLPLLQAITLKSARSTGS
jgi:hypothetical protein